MSPSPQGSARQTEALDEFLIDEDAEWLPSDFARRSAFLDMFRLWRRQVLPEYAAKATPGFLYLVTALPMIAGARDQLKSEGLWEAAGAAREGHPSWRRYCELLPRAQQALDGMEGYAGASLMNGVDDLMLSIVSAERRFREGAAQP